METYFKLKSGLPLSNACISKGSTTFSAVLDTIKQLPYGRTSDRSDFVSVLKEGKGTCSTKHAFLKAIAIENNFQNLELYLGIFKMNPENTPKIKTILEQNNLEYIPEAHCYLKLNENILDITFPSETEPSFVNTLVYEEIILPQQIAKYKIDVHQSYLETWIKTKHIVHSFADIWRIRESCIRHISA